jgi:hypothetical protein
VFLGANLADGCSNTRIAIKHEPDQVIIFHAKPFSESLARRLELRAEQDSTEIEEDSPYTHLLLLVVFFPF